MQPMRLGQVHDPAVSDDGDDTWAQRLMGVDQDDVGALASREAAAILKTRGGCRRT